MSNNRRTWETFEAMQPRPPKKAITQAQRYLGVCFQNGQGVAQDYQEAVNGFVVRRNKTTRLRNVIWGCVI